MEQLLSNFIKAFKVHVGTKTTDIVLHEYLAKVYEKFFDILHTILERRQDLSIDPSIECDDAAESMITLLKSEMDLLESMVDEPNTTGMDNLLSSHLDELEGIMGTAKGFIKKEKEDDAEKPITTEIIGLNPKK